MAPASQFIYTDWEQKFLLSSADMTEKAVTHKCSLRVTLPSFALGERKNSPEVIEQPPQAG